MSRTKVVAPVNNAGVAPTETAKEAGAATPAAKLVSPPKAASAVAASKPAKAVAAVTNVGVMIKDGKAVL